jgi:hypothetical protein
VHFVHALVTAVGGKVSRSDLGAAEQLAEELVQMCKQGAVDTHPKQSDMKPKTGELCHDPLTIGSNPSR